MRIRVGNQIDTDGEGPSDPQCIMLFWQDRETTEVSLDWHVPWRIIATTKDPRVGLVWLYKNTYSGERE